MKLQFILALAVLAFCTACLADTCPMCGTGGSGGATGGCTAPHCSGKPDYTLYCSGTLPCLVPDPPMPEVPGQYEDPDGWCYARYIEHFIGCSNNMVSCINANQTVDHKGLCEPQDIIYYDCNGSPQIYSCPCCTGKDCPCQATCESCQLDAYIEYTSCVTVYARSYSRRVCDKVNKELVAVGSAPLDLPWWAKN